MSRSTRRARLAAAMLAAALLPAACVDSPAAPEGQVGSTTFVLAPSLSLAGPSGAPAATAAQEGALNEAFRLVDGFRIQVRTDGGALLLDTLVTVTPGQAEYDFSLPVEATAGENLTVTLIAFQGETELFRSQGVQVEATAAGSAGSAQSPPPTVITLGYSGPGVAASSVELDRTHLVLGPGSEGTLVATVRDESGAAIPGVPLSWSSTVPVVATVEGGSVQGVSDGLARAVVTTPTGLEAEAALYVVGGELAFVEGGSLKGRAPAGGPVATLAGPGSGQPAWSADGARLFYVLGGSVRETGVSGALASGGWPSVHPDGTKLAFERGGRVWYVNDNGRNATEGPSGRTPSWADGSTLVLSGGSIERVRADGAGRETVAAGETGPPAVGPGGAVAFVAGGELRVTGRPEALATGVRGRPAWSADGRWLAVAGGSGLLVVPSAGGAPAVPLPGLGGASQPAFRPSGSLTAPPRVSLSGLDPDPLVPGSPVRILGSGFDWIIPANNRVVWPTREGASVGEILSVTPTSLETSVPRDVAAGEVRVENRGTQAALAFEPALAAIAVLALTPDERPVPGVRVGVTGPEDDAPVTGETDEEGRAIFPGLTPGRYTVHLQPPTGFTLAGEAERTVEVVGGVHEVEIRLAPEVAELRLEPETRRLEVGSTLSLRAVAVTAAGDVVHTPVSVEWGGSGSMVVAADGLEATLTGRAPSSSVGSSPLRVTVNGQSFVFRFTVTTFVRGRILREVDAGTPPPEPDDGPSGVAPATEPAIGVGVVVRKDGKIVAREASGGDGRFKVPGLLAGTQQVEVVAPDDRTPEPASVTVTLGADRPTGSADFLLALGGEGTVEVGALDTFTAFGQTQTLVVTARDADGEPVAGPVTYESTDEEVATVDGSGVVRAEGNGDVNIEVTAGDLTETVQVVVDQEAVSITLLEEDDGEIVPIPDEVLAVVGDTGTISWHAEDANGFTIDPEHDGPTIESIPPGIVSLGFGGLATAEAVGDAAVVASMDGVADTVWVQVLGVRQGSVVINTQNQLNTFASGRIGRIEGFLAIQGNHLTKVDELVTLLEVGGGVFIQNTLLLDDLSGLANLEYVGDDLAVRNNAKLPGLGDLTGLDHLSGSLYLADNLLLDDLSGLANLEYVGGEVEVTGNDVLSSLDDLTSLEHLGGSLLLRDNPALADEGNFPNLVAIEGDLVIEGGGSVVGLSALEYLGGTLQVGGTSSFDPLILRELDLSSLQSAGEVYIYDNPNLTTVDLGALTSVVGVEEDELRTARARSRPTESAGPTASESVASLRALFAEGERGTAARRAARGTGAAPIRSVRGARRSVASIEVVGGDLRVVDNPALATLSLTSLEYVGGDVEFAGDEYGCYYDCEESGTNLGLSEIDLPSLVAIGGNLLLERIHGPTGASFDRLESIGGYVGLVDNVTIEDFLAPMLESIENELALDGNEVLTTLATPTLERVGGLSILDNEALTSLDGLSAVTSGLTNLAIIGNLLLEDLGDIPEVGDPSGLFSLGTAPGTTYPIVAGNFTVTGNPTLCDTEVYYLLSVLDGRSEGNGVGGTETTAPGNKYCGPS